MDSHYNWFLEPQFENHFPGTFRNQFNPYRSSAILRLWNNITFKQCGQSIFIYRLVLKLNGNHFLFFLTINVETASKSTLCSFMYLSFF